MLAFRVVRERMGEGENERAGESEKDSKRNRENERQKNLFLDNYARIDTHTRLFSDRCARALPLQSREKEEGKSEREREPCYFKLKKQNF